MKSIEQLVPDIYAMLSSGHESSVDGLDTLCEDIGILVRDRLLEAGRPRKATVRMSNVGKPCTRQLWYEIKGYKGEKLQPHTRLKFLYGDVIEQLVLFLAREAGHTVEQRQNKVELDGIRGHIDAVIDGALVDVKSCSPYGFKKFEEGGLEEDDPFGYQAQLAGYKAALGIEEAAWVAMDKQNGHLGVFLLKSDYPVRSQISKVKAALVSDEPPERAFEPLPDGASGNMKLPVACSYCAFKQTCYPQLRTFLYATGPRFLTKVTRVPNVPEVQT
ncbi:MAG: hypothetical protein ACREBU_01550 [Nitrososphaera sp.]